MIVKRPSPFTTPPISLTQAELREELIELWSRLFEAELRADLDAEAEANGERARLRAIERAEPPTHNGSEIA